MILKIRNRLSFLTIFLHLNLKMDVQANHNDAQGADKPQPFLLLTKDSFLAELYSKQLDCYLIEKYEGHYNSFFQKYDQVVAWANNPDWSERKQIKSISDGLTTEEDKLYYSILLDRAEKGLNINYPKIQLPGKAG